MLENVANSPVILVAFPTLSARGADDHSSWLWEIWDSRRFKIPTHFCMYDWWISLRGIKHLGAPGEFRNHFSAEHDFLNLAQGIFTIQNCPLSVSYPCSNFTAYIGMNLPHDNPSIPHKCRVWLASTSRILLLNAESTRKSSTHHARRAAVLMSLTPSTPQQRSIAVFKVKSVAYGRICLTLSIILTWDYSTRQCGCSSPAPSSPHPNSLLPAGLSPRPAMR